MAVDWGKAGRFACFFYGLLRFFGFDGGCDCVIRRWFPGVFGRIGLQKILFGFVFFLCASMRLCAEKCVFIVVFFM